MKLFIPSLFIFVKLTPVPSSNLAQSVVDKWNSAAIWKWNNLTLIADHSTQANFENLRKAVPGKTKLYILDKKNRKFVCDKTEVGHIVGFCPDGTGGVLRDEKGRSVFYSNLDGLMIYTCIRKSAIDVMDVRLTHWKEVT